ncbi:MAG: hypothetical protein sL5_03700 [Candidatus Mesenet longicola]|uniref:NADH:ubiquinone oxidoreductase subunit NDUFA12 n=1 Tax=Candidatus Mesenet longicola TaxID=1892558 RepID=A0A8J3HUB6_9RICK|nr:MAG: hypothetical protein sGL2_09220 [Candidatus Mesenet longicola]GHM59377.1 MAG: hypothetical protein sL5_03700 [Candidatus Mesenet longicola]
MAFSDQIKFFFRKNKTLMGKDEYGNAYYEVNDKKTKRRWVIYNKIEDPVRIPPKWHLWLHYTSDNVPKTQDSLIRCIIDPIEIHSDTNHYLSNSNITYKNWSPND